MKQTGTEKRRTPTRTSAFGTTGRISHDASAYYARAVNPSRALEEAETRLSAFAEQVAPESVLDRIFCHSSEQMTELRDCCVHMMVTSPPYNVGKEYDQDLTMEQYRALLQAVFQETFRVLIPGGRACVNVANLGRKPYIPLHAYVIEEAATAGFFMRGEIVWQKAAGAGASTAWGSWRSPSNPTLRDTHEYILVFQKPPFKRKKPSDGRIATISRDEFLEYTKSVWTFGPESAKRAGHPAPFPAELPARLMQLYTYAGEVVLDPFMGTGATAIAAVQAGRRYVGYELSEEYVKRAEERVRRATGG